jgi:hypothetical protein
MDRKETAAPLLRGSANAIVGLRPPVLFLPAPTMTPAPAMLRSIMNLGINVLEPTHAGAYLVANNRAPAKLRSRTKAM